MKSKYDLARRGVEHLRSRRFGEAGPLSWRGRRGASRRWYPTMAWPQPQRAWAFRWRARRRARAAGTRARRSGGAPARRARRKEGTTRRARPRTQLSPEWRLMLGSAAAVACCGVAAAGARSAWRLAPEGRRDSRPSHDPPAQPARPSAVAIGSAAARAWRWPSRSASAAARVGAWTRWRQARRSPRPPAVELKRRAAPTHARGLILHGSVAVRYCRNC